MIPFASQRGGGQDLATHLLNSYDNEIVEVCGVRGAVAKDLHGAFAEWDVQAKTLTRCDKYLYSLSVNPDPAQGPLTREQYMDYIGRVEATLGLADQPRAVVFHTKYGREHCHVIWSRIDAEQQKAVHLAFDHDKLMRVTRGFARDHGLSLPKGYEKSRQVGQISLYEKVQERETGLSKEDHMRQVTEAWRHSDNARSFVQALSERGYVLATGKRPYVLVDLYGNVNALPKLIDDKTVRTKDIRAFLEKDYPLESLPSIEEAEALVAEHRKLIETALSEETYASQLAVLKHQQQERREGLKQAVIQAVQQRQHLRQAQTLAHKTERSAVRSAHRQHMEAVKAQRYENRATGLAAFLGRVTGMALVRKAWHRRQDRQEIEAYRAQRAQVKARQAQESRALERHIALDAKELERQQSAMRRVERRELAAFLRDQRKEQRIRDRNGGQNMPSLHDLIKQVRDTAPKRHDLLGAFEQAKERRWFEVPNIASAFDGASGRSAPDTGGDGRGRKPPETNRNADIKR